MVNVQTSHKLMSGGWLVFLLVISLGAPAAQQAPQTPSKEEGKQETPKETKKRATRVWTNDDFPSSESLPPATPKREEPEAKSKPSEPPDAATEKLLKLTPQERQDLIESDEFDIRDAQERIDALRNGMGQDTDDAERAQRMKEIERLEKAQSDTRHELEILRKLPPPKSEEKDLHQPTAVPPGGSSEPGTQSAPPPHQN
jgi:hypothetical protein